MDYRVDRGVDPWSTPGHGPLDPVDPLAIEYGFGACALVRGGADARPRPLSALPVHRQTDSWTPLPSRPSLW